MPYSVIETKKSNAKKTSLAAVPDGWLDVSKNLVYWPRSGMKSLCEDGNSTFEPNWLPNIITKVWHTQLERERAEQMVNHYLYSSDSEKERMDTDDDEQSTSRAHKKPVSKNVPKPPNYTISNSPVSMLYLCNNKVHMTTKNMLVKRR